MVVTKDFQGQKNHLALSDRWLLILLIQSSVFNFYTSLICILITAPFVIDLIN